MSVPTDDITGEPVAANHERKQRHPLLVWAWSLVHLDFVGIAFGALFFCLSLTPSLLPRDWLFQGLIGGLNANEVILFTVMQPPVDHLWRRDGEPYVGELMIEV